MTPEVELAAVALTHHSHVVCLTGAGMSVESGIRPFRGPGGLWTEHGEPDLNDYQRFKRNPEEYWKSLLHPQGFMAELHGALRSATPHAGHVALADLEAVGVVSFTITQNIDDLHGRAGSRRLAEIHGNHTLARCINCGRRFFMEDVCVDTLPPRCPTCDGMLKSDIVVFGEPIPDDVARTCIDEIEQADCLLMVGTSAYVYPAAGFPRHVKANGGTLIEIGPYPTEISDECDIIMRDTASSALPALLGVVRRRLASSARNG